MTLEEAKQLKPGDRVLVEMYIDGSSVFNEYGHVCLESAYVLPEAIREKIVQPRRKFKAGDVVLSKEGFIMMVSCNEEDSPLARLVDAWDPFTSQELNNNTWEELTLVCVVEDRADRSAAADGSGVTRKGGEV